MPNFMLLLHQVPEQHRTKSPDEFQAMLKNYMAWTDRIRAEGRHKGSNKLTFDAGKIIRTVGGRVTITDGPYAESKELVGGFYLIAAKDYDDACRVAETSPHLTYGGRIEVRQVDDIYVPET
jgi:hypothetical protein